MECQMCALAPVKSTNTIPYMLDIKTAKQKNNIRPLYPKLPFHTLRESKLPSEHSFYFRKMQK